MGSSMSSSSDGYSGGYSGGFSGGFSGGYSGGYSNSYGSSDRSYGFSHEPHSEWNNFHGSGSRGFADSPFPSPFSSHDSSKFDVSSSPAISVIHRLESDFGSHDRRTPFSSNDSFNNSGFGDVEPARLGSDFESATRRTPISSASSMVPGSGLRPDFNLDIKSPLPGLSGNPIPGLGAGPFILDPILAKMRSKLDEGQETNPDFLESPLNIPPKPNNPASLPLHSDFPTPPAGLASKTSDSSLSCSATPTVHQPVDLSYDLFPTRIYEGPSKAKHTGLESPAPELRGVGMTGYLKADTPTSSTQLSQDFTLLDGTGLRLGDTRLQGLFNDGRTAVDIKSAEDGGQARLLHKLESGTTLDASLQSFDSLTNAHLLVVCNEERTAFDLHSNNDGHKVRLRHVLDSGTRFDAKLQASGFSTKGLDAQFGIIGNKERTAFDLNYNDNGCNTKLRQTIYGGAHFDLGMQPLDLSKDAHLGLHVNDHTSLEMKSTRNGLGDMHHIEITFGDTYLLTSLANALNLDKIQYGAKAEKYYTGAFPKLDWEGLDLTISAETSKTWSPDSKTSVGLDLNVLDKSAVLRGKHQLTVHKHVDIEALVTVATNHSLPSPKYEAKLSITPKVEKK